MLKANGHSLYTKFKPETDTYLRTFFISLVLSCRKCTGKFPVLFFFFFSFSLLLFLLLLFFYSVENRKLIKHFILLYTSTQLMPLLLKGILLHIHVPSHVLRRERDRENMGVLACVCAFVRRL